MSETTPRTKARPHPLGIGFVSFSLMLLAWVMLVATPARSVEYRIDKVADGFVVPWSLAFLPDGGFLVTERDGALWQVEPDGTRQQIKGLPDITVIGQGGLLDVVAAEDFSSSRRIFLSYTTDVPGGAGTAMASAILPEDADRIERVFRIFQLQRGNQNGRHFGGRIVKTADGHLFLTVGDMGEAREAQNVGSHWGKILRLRVDGTVPRDNPFQMRRNALPEIWSLGHRNPQGLTLTRGGALVSSEHGAKGGDELNWIEAGANYGWPVISYGTHYDGRKIGEGTEKRGMRQPLIYWDPSIAPSGMMVYESEMFPEWRGDLFVGSLKFDYIAQVAGKGLTQVSQIKTNETQRVRDVREAPDGSIWFLSEGNGAVYRLWRP